MHEHESQRGRALARLPRRERDDLVARLMFGRHRRRAAEAIAMLMRAWGIAGPSPSETAGATDRD